MINQDLIEKAILVASPKNVGEFTIGNVGAALITDREHVYLGVCIDVSSGMGFCAEHNAVGAMITAGEYKIDKIVAVSKNDKGETHILSPCGRCREFMRQVNEANLETDVILEKNKTVKLKELLPYHDSCIKI